MPAGFDKCKKDGGRIRTEDAGDGKYRHVCWLEGKRYPGYEKTRQSQAASDAMGKGSKGSHNSSHNSSSTS